MIHASITSSHAPNLQLMRRIEKGILIAAAALAVIALIAHHTGISATVALLALLAVTIIERLKAQPEAGWQHATTAALRMSAAVTNCQPVSIPSGWIR